MKNSTEYNVVDGIQIHMALPFGTKHKVIQWFEKTIL